MPKTTALLIDSSNIYHCLKKAEGDDYLDYKLLFSNLSKSFDLTEIHFYDAMKNSSLEPAKYAKQQHFHQLLKSFGSVKIHTTKLQYRQNITPAEVDRAAEHIGIVDACKKKLWQLLEYLNLVERQKEKGVDVMLASDAIEIALMKRCECIIIFSGDADYAPAVRLVQRYGGEVVNLHVYEGSSKDLRDPCRKHILLEFEDDGKMKMTQHDNQTGAKTII